MRKTSYTSPYIFWSHKRLTRNTDGNNALSLLRYTFAIAKKAILVLQWHVEFTLIEGLLGSVQDAWKEALMKGILNQRYGCNRKMLCNIHLNYKHIYMRQNYLK